ncbi:hypothetical protein DSM101010T_05950 [Desulfovibrio subterraneus]|uniref:Uncharacterized protein n=1 Tax=Desulfovibrio subterraneus TaxID=2718620 RepID=A0A7J0BEU6_9BACT|nr:hypothetical protein DSM101010T_05950 [Desulfovibrio subterraneus]
MPPAKWCIPYATIFPSCSLKKLYPPKSGQAERAPQKASCPVCSSLPGMNRLQGTPVPVDSKPVLLTMIWKTRA